MPKSNSSVSIDVNLLPQDPFFDTILGRTLRWALSAGRYLIIFTELVVIISFATRFTLDRQVTDLNTSIHHKIIVIESYGDLEENIRLTQSKLTDYQIIEKQSNITDIFEDLTQVAPQDILLEKLAINQTNIVVAGSAPSQQIFNYLINNLQLSPKFKNITVDKIEASKISSGFDFRLRADTATAGIERKEAVK
ncbi:MAG: PilN domain-containing protein [Patescibacteria group bacterium]|nr:PilN domain-containing protein [Patescibacteria group bacterium]